MRETDASGDGRRLREATSDPSEMSRGSEAELNSAVAAICASAFSIEALVLVLANMAIPAETLAAWKSKTRPPAVAGRLQETLKLSIAVPGARVTELLDGMSPVFTLRGDAVHYTEGMSPPVSTPDRGFVSQAMSDYNATSARSSTDAMLEIYRELAAHPKKSVADWVGRTHHAFDLLER